MVLHSLFNSVNRILTATLLLIENIEEALKTNYIIIGSRKISYNTFILKNNNHAKKIHAFEKLQWHEKLLILS